MSCTRGSKSNNSKVSVKEETQRDSSPVEGFPDFSLICRICASTSEYLIPIFDGEGLKTRLKEKIERHLPIKIENDNQLPTKLCYQCTSTLLAWNELVECCQQSEFILKQQLESQITVQKESLENVQIITKQEENSVQEATNQRYTERCQPIVKLEQLDISQLKCSGDISQKNIQVTNIYTCSYCELHFGAEDLYKKHLISSHSELLFHCDECDTYVDRQELILHMSLHAVRNSSDAAEEDVQNGDSKADDGSQLFSDTESNNGFLAIPDSIFKAIEDVKGEDSSTNVNEHLVTVTTDTNDKKEKVLQCPLCGKTFRAPSSFFYHKKFAHSADAKEKECEVCHRKFATNNSLRDHMSIHTGDKSLQCQHCGKEFRSKASVYIHIKNMHTDGKEFICNECNRSFRWKQKLIRHQHSHTKEKNFFCPECDRGFSIRCDLTRHMKTHTKLKPYKCTKCGMTFGQRRYLKNHMSLKHELASNIK